ncbi:TIGR03943 family protein [Arthrobacter sp. SLBN-53]|uniref:TIGR03943 family putative permease subunit n=1 Tax=Arthrobacter sp. SLBN-53 TaxID=2768412 RepID=UPI00114EEE05|nr:TIGR03943 family protein [Arthrobacter sp. SLBN-53]TQK29128.1 putative repeat protein (TIGR03943 family) [Arthrobacter sp. SLBN-53]
MSRETENTLLLLIGLSTAIIATTGSFLRYVKPALLPWLWITAAVLIALALTAIIGDIRRGPRRYSDHGHRTGIGWLLIVPIALLAFVVPPALGPQAARPIAADTAQTAPRRPFPPLPAGAPAELSLPALLIRIAQDSAETLRDREITVTGFTIRDGERTYLGRIVILCCAADAQLARATLTGPAARAAADLPDGSWVRVRGEVKDLFQHAAVPEFSIDDVESVAQPENTYAF